MTPTEAQRRSFVYRKLVATGATFEEVNGYAAAMTCGADEAAETAQAKVLGIADLSPLRRIGFKGWNIDAWLAAHGAVLGAESNVAYPQDDGARIARLAPGEVVVLGDLTGGGRLVDTLETAWSMEDADGCFFVPREEVACWFRITGQHVTEMFAKICAVDLRLDMFPPNAIAQTNVARLNAIIIRADLPTPTFDLIVDIASADYLWLQLIDAATEYTGKPVGLAAMRRLGR